MSDAPLTKEDIEQIRDHGWSNMIHRAVVSHDELKALCTLALRGLAREPLEWPETDAEITAAHIEEACETIMRGNTHRNDVISSLGTLRRLAIRGLEAERAATEPLLVSVEKILDDHSAWIARPSPEVSRSVAMAAAIRAMAALDERIEFAEHETAERVREETLEECAAIADGWHFGTPISREIRALKKGPSNAQDS